MVFLRALFSLSLLAVGHAGPNGTSNIKWGPCNATEVNSTIPIQCASVFVPLDYTDHASNATLKLELAKISATSQPVLGSILLNFGGPGEPGRSGLAALGSTLLPLSGGQHDLIAFDPRGTGNTLLLSCGETVLDAAASAVTLSNASDVALGENWAAGGIISYDCFQNGNATGSLMGTAFVARDLISVVDQLGEDGMLRYWGFSYGTTLGATVASMFPDRIEKMILDGVQNPHEYYHANADFQEWTDSDKEFSAIFTGCQAAPNNCALAHGNATATELEQAAWGLLDTVKYHPIPIGGSLILDYTTLKSILSYSLYSPAGWPTLASLLDMLLTGNFEGALPLLEGYLIEIGGGGGISLAFAELGIHCGDLDLRLSSFDDLIPVIDRLYTTSRIMGDAATIVTTSCSQWKMAAKERYQGNFQVQTSKPVLLIGNTYDGLTPLVSAYNLSSGLEGSVVLEVNGYGHTSLAAPSICTLKASAAYWTNGTLPRPGTICKLDAPLYSNVTWTDIFQKASGNSTSL
ncbi:hypothetical protein B7494_g5254 [Chlorociboria aeruginascens]|nr:hypothetical protein B7494_g5254 [Chlorociboria aeruginascens]